jgi:hypothetical protein
MLCVRDDNQAHLSLTVPLLKSQQHGEGPIFARWCRPITTVNGNFTYLSIERLFSGSGGGPPACSSALKL